MMKKIKLMSALVLAGLSLTACGQSQKASDEQVSLGIIQLISHEDLDNTRQGFLEVLAEAGLSEGDGLTVNFQNAEGDQSKLQTMIEQFAGKTDLNLAIATPSAQSLAHIDEETPAIFAAVTDPVGAGLVDSLEEPGGNITGSSNAQDVSEQIDLLLKVLPDIETVGFIYNASEANAEVQVKRAREALEERGINTVAKPVTNTNDVQDALTSLVSQVDAVYLPTDSVLAATMPTIAEVLKESKTPALASSNGFLEAALLTTGVDYIEVGRQAGELALQILDGQNPAELPVRRPDKITVSINEEMAEILGLNPEDIAALID